jgi:glycosyltransferase involved in cell wall biosynthesis
VLGSAVWDFRQAPGALLRSPVAHERLIDPVAEEPSVRIAIIAPPWVPVPPPLYGGTEVVLDGLARGLQAAGNDVLLYTTGDSTCPVPKAWVLPDAVGVGTSGSATELRHVVNAYDVVRDWGADVVHDHTLIGPVYADRFDDVAVVTTNHGPFQSELGDYYRAIGHRVPIIAISHHQASTAAGVPIAAVIHHGVDVEHYQPGPGDGGYAVFLGRMCAEKGVHTAIEVARTAGMPLKIAAKLQEAQEFAYFEHVVSPLLHDGVEFIGEVGGEDKHNLLGHACCLLNPVGWPEPFGMVMIEALACGTPVIATPNGSVPELVDNGRTGFVGATEANLVDGLLRLDELDRAACRVAAVERFSIERMAADHLAGYEAIVERRVRSMAVV